MLRVLTGLLPPHRNRDELFIRFFDSESLRLPVFRSFIVSDLNSGSEVSLTV